MDAFAFDRKFARFVSLVSTEAISDGTLMYSESRAQISQLSLHTVTGTVAGKKGTLFRTKLVDNSEGGFSGSCSCPDFFNCAHSYALARAARDQIKGIPSKKPSESAAGHSPTVAALEARQTGISRKELIKCASLLDRLWSTAKKSGFLLYPRDLKSLGICRRTPKLPDQEPLRLLKKMLEAAPLDNPIELADTVKRFCQHKGIELLPIFAQISIARKADQRLRAIDNLPKWKDKPCQATVELQIEGTDESDWFRVKAVPKISGLNFSTNEINQLVKANGAPVQLGEKGWHRASLHISDSLKICLSDLGLDPARGNIQRIHALQVKALVPEDARQDESWNEALNRNEALRQLTLPEPPANLAEILRPYQREGFQFLCHLTLRGFGGILADDMGLGKTLQTLSWLMWLKERIPHQTRFRTLIICPKSVSDNWLREAIKFKTGLDAQLFEPKKTQKRKDEPNILVANYSQLRIQSEYFLSIDWDAAILDEGQYIKTPSSQVAKAACQLKARNRLILSGTPIENRIIDLWSLMRFAMPRLLGPLPTFATNYNERGNQESPKNLKRRIQPFILRRIKTQVAQDLPARIEEEIHCEMEGEQLKLYEAEFDTATKLLKTRNGDESVEKQSINILKSLLRLRLICCDPRLVDENHSAPSAKVEALLDILEPLILEGHKALVFSQFVSMLDILDHQLKQRNIPTLKLTGKTQNRQKLIEKFQQSDQASAFLLSLKAAGSGLNLTAASYVILFDPWWNPAVEAQAIDRTHRIGQKSQVVAYRLLAKNTIEEKIRLLQRAKADLANSIIQEESLSSTLDLDTIRELFSED